MTWHEPRAGLRWGELGGSRAYEDLVGIKGSASGDAGDSDGGRA